MILLKSENMKFFFICLYFRLSKVNNYFADMLGRCNRTAHMSTTCMCALIISQNFTVDMLETDVLTEEAALSRCRVKSLDRIKYINCWGLNLSDVSLKRELST